MMCGDASHASRCYRMVGCRCNGYRARSVDRRGLRMGANIYIYCPSGEEGAIRGELEDDVEAFFGDAAEFVGALGGVPGFNLDFELADGEDVEAWVVRLRDFLKEANARPSTFFDVFPEGWEPG